MAAQLAFIAPGIVVVLMNQIALTVERAIIASKEIDPEVALHDLALPFFIFQKKTKTLVVLN